MGNRGYKKLWFMVLLVSVMTVRAQSAQARPTTNSHSNHDDTTAHDDGHIFGDDDHDGTTTNDHDDGHIFGDGYDDEHVFDDDGHIFGDDHDGFTFHDDGCNLDDGHEHGGEPVVPEPSTMALLGLGMSGLGWRQRKRAVRR